MNRVALSVVFGVGIAAGVFNAARQVGGVVGRSGVADAGCSCGLGGFDVGRGRLETVSYDLLASEARIASFVAIAKGDIPQESWFRLGRSHTVLHGETR